MTKKQKGTPALVAVYTQDESGWWQARVPAKSGCHTQGRTLSIAKRRIREAVALFASDGETVQDRVTLPAGPRDAIQRYRTGTAAAHAAASEAASAGRAAVDVLMAPPLNLSLREAAEVLGLSHQRVHQLRNAR